MPKPKKSPILLPIAAVVALSLLIFHAYIWWMDPLYRLERIARSIPAISSMWAHGGNNFYGESQVLIRIIEHDLGAHVSFQDNLEDLMGETLPVGERTIKISNKLEWTDRYETLLHEAGHLLQPPTLGNGGEAEAFAEGVLVVVATYQGDSTAIYRSANYLAMHKDTLHVLRDYRVDILRSASILEVRR